MILSTHRTKRSIQTVDLLVESFPIKHAIGGSSELSTVSTGDALKCTRKTLLVITLEPRAKLIVLYVGRIVTEFPTLKHCILQWDVRLIQSGERLNASDRDIEGGM